MQTINIQQKKPTQGLLFCFYKQPHDYKHVFLQNLLHVLGRGGSQEWVVRPLGDYSDRYSLQYSVYCMHYWVHPIQYLVYTILPLQFPVPRIRPNIRKHDSKAIRKLKNMYLLMF